MGDAGNGDTGICTSGAAAEDSSGNDYILTAAHCFALGASIYGEGDPTGDFGFTESTHYIGQVTSVSGHWDTEVITTCCANGSGSISEEADSPVNTNYPVLSDAYSYDQQHVCQDGAVSYYQGHGVPCGIVVLHHDTTWTVQLPDGSIHTARGCMGTAAYTATHGDSGGLVFGFDSAGLRQARGSVSIGTPDDKTLWWTETPNSFSAFGLHLNPWV